MTVTGVSSSILPTITHVADQTGIIGGVNPMKYNPSNPITVFIIQAILIVFLCRILHFPLSLIRQPRVIAEVIGGIILGPTVLGRIPGFSAAIFPPEAMPNLNLVANLGLVLFLFLVGLEVDFRIMVENWKVALSVGAVGMILPFGLGAAIAVGLYEHFGDDTGVNEGVSFGVFLLFVGVAFSITAFPVLCRILTELHLLGTNVGVITLAAGVGNDVVGWILLALTVAIVNAGTGITALYVLLVAVGYVLFLFFAVKPFSTGIFDGQEVWVVTDLLREPWLSRSFLPWVLPGLLMLLVFMLSLVVLSLVLSVHTKVVLPLQSLKRLKI